MPIGDNPKYVIFSLLTGSDREHGLTSGRKNPSNPSVYDLGENNKHVLDPESYIISKLRTHIKKYGTLDEIIISGHGNTESMSSRDNYNEINTKSLLIAIEKLKNELGKKITNRIVFDGCGTLSQLNYNQISFYRDYADKNDTEVVGSTSGVFQGDGLPEGRFVQFTPIGGVIRDKLDTRYNPFALIGDDRTWVDAHLGHTQAEAESTIRQELINTASALVKFRNTPAYSDSEFNNDKRSVEESFSQQIHAKDAQTDKTDVLLSTDNKAAVIISSDGMVRTFGDIKLHHLTESEKYKGIKKIEEYIGNIESEITDDNRFSIEGGEKAMGGNDVSSDNPSGLNFSVLILDGNKKALLATESGGYEVIEIKIKPSVVTTNNIECLNSKSSPRRK